MITIKQKIKALLLSAVLLSQSALLSSCMGRGESDVHVFYYNYSDTYVTSVRAALDEEWMGHQLTYQNYDGNNNQTTQTEQVKTAITKGAGVILVNLVNTGSADAAGAIVSAAVSVRNSPTSAESAAVPPSDPAAESCTRTSSPSADPPTDCTSSIRSTKTTDSITVTSSPAATIQ